MMILSLEAQTQSILRATKQLFENFMQIGNKSK